MKPTGILAALLGLFIKRNNYKRELLQFRRNARRHSNPSRSTYQRAWKKAFGGIACPRPLF